MTRRDWTGGAIVAASFVALLLFRADYVEPRDWAAACAVSTAPLPCVPREALLWLQEFGLWGFGALALGVWAFFGAPFAVAVGAVALGVSGVVNYNASLGMLAVALGAWAWLRREPSSPRVMSGI